MEKSNKAAAKILAALDTLEITPSVVALGLSKARGPMRVRLFHIVKALSPIGRLTQSFVSIPLTKKRSTIGQKRSGEFDEH